MENVLVCDGISKIYGKRENETRALDGVSLSVVPGEFIAIMGPSGSGKTTLLNCISTIDEVSSGHIYVQGHEITALRQKDLARFRREQLGFIFQDSNMLDTMTVRENISLALTISKVNAAEITQRVEAIAQTLNITDQLDRYPYEISGGQRQRAAAARAIVTNPSLVLADEPTGALDSKNARVLLESLENMNKSLGATIMMVTHDSVAASYANRVLFIKDGKLFTELHKGEAARTAFFDCIISVLAQLGGEDVPEGVEVPAAAGAEAGATAAAGTADAPAAGGAGGSANAAVPSANAPAPAASAATAAAPSTQNVGKDA